MSVTAIQQRIEALECALRDGNFAEAFTHLRELKSLQPEVPTWPKRESEIHRAMGHRDQELEALAQAFQLQIDCGQTARAVATGNRILDLNPDDSATQERLHLLYTIPSRPIEAIPPAANSDYETSCPAIALDSLPSPDRPDAPLDEIVLIEVVSDARPFPIGNSEQTGASEIPLESNEIAQPLDLHLDAPVPTPISEPPSIARPQPPAIDTSDEVLRRQLFACLPDREIERLVSELDTVEVEANRVFICEGDTPDCMYVILDGALVPIVGEGLGKQAGARMGVLEAGDFFGEIGLLAQQPRNASVRSLVASRLLVVDRRTVWRLIRSHREIFSLLLRTLRLRLVDRVIYTSPFFACFSRATRGAVARQFQMIEVRDGTAVIQQGLSDRGIFVLLAGLLDVTQSSQSGEKHIATLSPGEVLGEQALLYNQGANATVTARGKCWLLALSEARFHKIVSDNPRLTEILRKIAEQRGRDNRNLYVDP
jgi:CRP-like cAMP-binding protein